MKKFPFLAYAFLLCSSAIAATPPTAPLTELTQRVAPSLQNRVKFERIAAKDGKDTYRYLSNGETLTIFGSSNSALAAGLRGYLSDVAGMDFSWSRETNAPSPKSLPKADFSRTSPWKWRSTFNHCVFSYTTPYWDWKKWSAQIDREALSGANQAFLLIGHEKVWQNTLKRLGFSDQDIARWIPSPAFQSWWHFNNLQGVGGTLSQAQIDANASLATKAATRMRDLGIEPVTLGFYGMVPLEFSKYFPQAKIVNQGKWISYDRPLMLDPTDPAFAKIAEIYYDELKKIFGPVRMFAGDPFHEGGNPGDINLPAAFKNIQDAMIKANPDAIWVMFGWQNNPRLDALTQLKPEQILIQQTSYDVSTLTPASGSFRDYQNKIPWTLQVIHNFGGNHGFYGNLETLAKAPQRAQKWPGLVSGFGDCPEGLEANPITAEMLATVFWSESAISIQDENGKPGWLKQTIARRYDTTPAIVTSSGLFDAWKNLERSSYRTPLQMEGVSDRVIATRPGPSPEHARKYTTNQDYADQFDRVEAWSRFLNAPALAQQAGIPNLIAQTNYRFDLIDISREVTAFYAQELQRDMIQFFTKRDRPNYDQSKAKFLSLITDVDALLSTDYRWHIKSWTDAVRAQVPRPDQARELKNAKNLITLWENKAGDLNNYASRAWGGLMKDVYLKRWQQYTDNLDQLWSKQGAQAPNYQEISPDRAFIDTDNDAPLGSTADTYKLSKQLYHKIIADLAPRLKRRWSTSQLASSKEQKFEIRFLKPPTSQAPKSYKITLKRDLGAGGAITLISPDLSRQNLPLNQAVSFDVPNSSPQNPNLDVKFSLELAADSFTNSGSLEITPN